MLSGFPQGVYVTNSQLTKFRYGRRIRRAFLFGALRTHSLMAREELAEMVSPLTAAELLVQLKKELTTEIALVPGIHQSKFRKYPAFPYFKKKIGRLALFHLAWLYANQNIDQADLEQARIIYAWCEKKYGLENFSQMALTDLALLSIRTNDLDPARRAVERANTKLAFLANFQPRALRMKLAQGCRKRSTSSLGLVKT